MKRKLTVPKTTPARSRIMSRIRGHGNLTTELRLIGLMRAHGITGWRRGVVLPGKPDFVFPAARLVVFVDGCFWHGCRCKRLPTAHRAFWRSKIETNRARDTRLNKRLRKAGWKVLRFWEHQLKSTPTKAVGRLNTVLRRSDKNGRRWIRQTDQREDKQ